VATADEVDPENLELKTWVNGELRQTGTTSLFVRDIPTLIEYISDFMSLEPNDVILTGTPHGVGMAAKPPRWLKPGDTVTIETERIGRLTNPVVLEPR